MAITKEERIKSLLEANDRERKLLTVDLPKVLEVLDKHNIFVNPWEIYDTSLTIELYTETDFKNFPTPALGDLLKLFPEGKFVRFQSKNSGQICYYGYTENNFTVYIRIGPAICKVKKVKTGETKPATEVEEWVFEKDCDPLFLDVEKGGDE